MTTKVSKVWIEFWEAAMVAMYGKGDGKYVPSEIIKRVMSRYEITQIKPPKTKP